jgi:three-Cys-motif partner protein
MSGYSTIEWTDATWNPVTGCTKVSEGCAHCYAERLAERFRGIKGHPYEQGFDLRLWPERLAQPLRWKSPRRIFVNSMSDLFHHSIPREFLVRVFQVMETADWHIYQVLTKRSSLMRDFVNERYRGTSTPSHIWLGVSVEDRAALTRVRHLQQTAARVRFISAEPLLGPLGELPLTGINWVIVGGESGPDFRPMEAEWARAIRDQCLKAGVAFFFKQWGGLRPTSGGHLLDDRAWIEYPTREQDRPRNDTWKIEITVGQERLPRAHAGSATTVPPKVDEDDNSMGEAASAVMRTAMIVPEAYHGREQTYVKHRILKLYLDSWAQKLASRARRQAVSLWYIDCFAGPWNAAEGDYRDTSICIALEALNAAATTWGREGFSIDVHAVFVEKDPTAFTELQGLLPGMKGWVQVHPLPGEFGAHVPTIQELIGADPAFLFVDPKGWKGAAMRYIAPLSKRPGRDVMINVMFDHINRFKDAQLTFIQAQMQDFFGHPLSPRLSEEALMQSYRDQLKSTCGLEFAADLIVPHPTKERTKFRLVVGGHNKAVIQLFREVERKVAVTEAEEIRQAAKERSRLLRTQQLPLGLSLTPDKRRLTSLRERDLAEMRTHIHTILAKHGTRRFDALWPVILEACHLTLTDVKQELWKMRQQGILLIDGVGPGERSVKDHHILRLPIG